MSKERNHSYLYTVKVRNAKTAEFDGDEVQIEAYNIAQAAHKIGREIDDVIFVGKAILQ
jgi:hypothetical protein